MNTVGYSDELMKFIDNPENEKCLKELLHHYGNYIHTLRDDEEELALAEGLTRNEWLKKFKPQP